MKLFDRFLKNDEKDAASAESTNNWENMTPDADSTATEQATERLTEQERQERKLVGAFSHDPSMLNQPDFHPTEEERDAVYRKMTNGEITTDTKKDLLKKIVAPLDKKTTNPDNVFASIGSKHERRILAYMSGAGFDNWEHLSTAALTKTYQNYPTPYELADPLNHLLDNIKTHNAPEKYQSYLNAAEKLQDKIYGKRFQYYQALESLQDKANHYVAEQNSRASVLAAYHQGDTIPVNTEPITEPITERITEPITEQITERVEQPIIPETSERVTVRYLNDKEAKKILKHSKIDGDDFYYDGKEYSLTPKTLEKYGLAPSYEFELENAKIDLSKPFHVGSHTAVMSYVTTGKETKVCSYYRSNSQGIWRYLPDYVSSNNPAEIIDWFGKGYDEESLNLPNATQYALELITSTQNDADVNYVQASHAFAGTAKRYNSRAEYMATKEQHALRGEHYQEVPETPTFSLGRMSRQKSSPDNLDLIGPSAPNFATSINDYRTSTSLYGPISVEGVRSQDGRLEYTFNRDHRDRAWLSHIEVANAPISSHGLRTAWATTGDFGTPLYEYDIQDGGYGDHSDRHHRYVNMWTNYLSHMPLIQKYLKSRGKAPR